MQSKREHKTICAIKEPGFGYNGEYTDAATGMIYLRARFYDPSMNRFSQKDALRGNINNPLSLNRYLYCENDPVNFVDSSGRAKKATQSLAGNSYSAAISKTKMTDGGNSQREAAIYGGGSSSAGAKARELARANAVLANTYAPGSKAAQQAQINYSNTVKQTTSGSKSSYTGNNTTYTPVPSKSSAAASQNVNNEYYNAVCNGGKALLVGFDINKNGTDQALNKSDITDLLKFIALVSSVGAMVIGNVALDAIGDKTLTVGVESAASFGIFGSASIGVSIDTKGKIGKVTTVSVGGGTPNIGNNAFISITNAGNITDLSGMSNQVGGSVGYIGGEIIIFQNPETNQTYGGVTISGGGSVLPAEMHGTVANTEVKEIYDLKEPIGEWLLIVGGWINDFEKA